MKAITPHYSKEEFARQGDELYEHKVRPNIDRNDEGKFVVINIDTGDYEIDIDELDAYDRLIARHPESQVWVMQVGSRYARRFGPPYESVAI
jgi:predicted  nucleic acid-binding Zn-ribbon protein